MLRNEDSTRKNYNLIQLRRFAGRVYSDGFTCGAGLSAVVAGVCDLSDGNFDHPYLTSAALVMSAAVMTYNRWKNGEGTGNCQKWKKGRNLGLSKLEKDLQLEDPDCKKP